MTQGKRRWTLCYRHVEWHLVELPAEYRRAFDIAVQRVRTLPHDAAGQPLEHLLASAYLQGWADAAHNLPALDGERRTS